MQESPHRPLVLASTSVYRKELLGRLHLLFEAVPPGVDETPFPNEKPAELAARLALAKARAVSDLRPDCVVIGSDQVADLHGIALGKPGNFERAQAQLQQMRGQTVVFQTAMAVVCAQTGYCAQALVSVHVRYRCFSDAEIDHYLRREQPFDCAGSSKSEGLGIAMMESIGNDDPTALIGLPLIRLCAMLRGAGIAVMGTL